MEVSTMSHRPAARPALRPLVRTSHFDRSQQQAIVRAYELALPIVRQPLTAKTSAQRATAAQGQHFVPQTLAGG
jgi:hypothetical protein